MKLLADISAHGLGHLAQTAAVLNELHAKLPDIEVFVRSGLPRDRIIGALPFVCEYYPADDGFGVVMKSALEVDRARTHEAYMRLHAQFDDRLERLEAWLRAGRFNCVLSNISYPILAAARRARIPAVAMSSLNWLDVYSFYASPSPETSEIVDRIRSCYDAANSFLRLVPGMPMRGLQTIQVPGVLAAQGHCNREGLVSQLGIERSRLIVLLAFGGMLPAIPPPFAIEDHDFSLIGPPPWAMQGLCTMADDLGMNFVDLIASCDFVVTKPGYGIVTELARAATPALLVSRGDWPEEPHLVSWLQAHGRMAFTKDIIELNRAAVENHIFALSRLHKGRPLQDGARYVAQHISNAIEFRVFPD